MPWASILIDHSEMLSDFNVIKGFLNLVVAQQYWKDFLESDLAAQNYGIQNHGRRISPGS